MTSKSDEERSGQKVGEKLAARQQLTCAQCRKRCRVEQIELKVYSVGQLERTLGVDGHVVPDARVRNVDCSEEIRRRRAVST